MTAEQFAQECLKYVPTREQLKVKDYSENVIQIFLKNFRLNKNENFIPSENSLFDIIKNYDSGSFTVGGFSFLQEVSASPKIRQLKIGQKGLL